MTIGWYAQNGGSGSSTPQAVDNSDPYLITLLGADLAFHFDMQNAPGLADGASVPSITTETGETFTEVNAGLGPTFAASGINGHPALQLDNASNNAISSAPTKNITGVTEYTIATLARLPSWTTATGIADYSRYGGPSDEERLNQSAIGLLAWETRFIFDTGLSSIPYNFATTRPTVLTLARRSAAGQLDVSAYDIDSLDGGAVSPVTETTLGDMIFEAQPTITLGDNLFGSTSQLFIGEHFFANRRLTDIEVINLAAHLRSKWS